MIGAVHQPRSASMTASPAGWGAAGGGQCRGAVGGGDDLVTAGGQGDPQRAEQMRVVVDDQDCGHGYLPPAAGVAMGRVTVMVSPPPGVSAGVMVPSMASMKPRAMARPRPSPAVVVRSCRRWNGWNIRSRSASGTP